MLFKNSSIFTVAFSILMLSAQVGHAGSVTGLSNSSVVINCDERRSNGDTSWCTAVAANQIYNRCLVIVRSDADPLIRSCDWQSCGPVAFVGARPKRSGGNVVEYGLSTPSPLAANPPSSWNLNTRTNEVLPKFPFPRNYMTIAEFVERRGMCLAGNNSTDQVQKKLCPIDRQFFHANSYFACLKRHLPSKLGTNL